VLFKEMQGLHRAGLRHHLRVYNNILHILYIYDTIYNDMTPVINILHDGSRNTGCLCGC
jgi:hypothetical protein